MHSNNNDNKQGQQKVQTSGKVPLWKKKRDEARKRKEQGQIRFVSSGVYKDGKQEQQVANGQVHHRQPATLPTTTKEVKEEPSVKKENVPVNPPPLPTDSSILLISSSSKRVVEHGPGLSSSNTNGDGENKAGGPGWIETDKGMLVMQMMQRMGYEHGKGLGRNNQGIVEPIRAVANPGKLALGAEKKVKKNLPPLVKPMPPPPPMANHRLPIDYPMPPPMDYSNQPQPQSEEGDGAKYSGAKAKQMQYETQVMQTLRSAGFNQSHAEEVWQSMSVLAKHGVMQLGMGLGLVKRRAAIARRENAASAWQNRVGQQMHHEKMTSPR